MVNNYQLSNSSSSLPILLLIAIPVSHRYCSDSIVSPSLNRVNNTILILLAVLVISLQKKNDISNFHISISLEPLRLIHQSGNVADKPTFKPYCENIYVRLQYLTRVISQQQRSRRTSFIVTTK